MIRSLARFAVGAALGCGFAAQAIAQTPELDWIDEFPSVTAVAHAAFEELKVTAQQSTYDITRDDDQVAVNLAATFVLVRRTAMYLYNAEPSLAPTRVAKLRAIVAAYEEAELTIGRGAAGRRGYITNATAGRGCREGDLACYQRWFANDITNITGRAEYRERILARLFPCGDRGRKLYELHQSFGLRTPFLPSPAATGQITPQLAGLAPAGCAAYGGDANRNGLCDDWERPAQAPTPSAGAAATPSATPAFRAGAAGCVPIGLLEVRRSPGGGLRVAIDAKTTQPGTSIRFRVRRAATEKGDSNALTIWEQEATIRIDRDSAAPLHVIVASGDPLEPDAARPFLVVDTVAVHSRGPVHCEQPLQKWEQRHLPPPAPRGLHGPYDSVEDAMRRDGATAITWRLMNAGRGDLIPDFVWELIGSRREFGYVIAQDTRRPDGKFYTSPPVPSSYVPKDSSDQPIFLERDYITSFERGFEGSCENASDYKIAALVHTHPDAADFYAINDFSMDDYNFLFGFRFRGEPSPKMVMLNGRDRYIRIFTARPSDRPFQDWELEKKRFPDWNPLWRDEYSPRVMILCVGAALELPSCRR